MPVLELSLTKLKSYALNRIDQREILEALPYLGLDIESESGDNIAVEYSPNRPDFSSEAGIARALVGYLGLKTGIPQYDFKDSGYTIDVADDEIRKIRPFIFGLYSEIRVNEELIKQLITMQEDLHNGLGRKREVVAIGIHNAEVISQGIRYFSSREETYSFVPLGDTKARTIKQILQNSDQGKQYGKILSAGVFPLLEDSEGHLLSFPPIINGERTRLKEGISKLFIDVTATDERAGDAVIAIIASMLADSGALVERVLVKGASTSRTPEMSPHERKFDKTLANRTIGFDFSFAEAKKYLARCRIDINEEGIARIPRYRADIIHPIDLAEELALGYGIAKIEPQETLTSLSGSFNGKLVKLDGVIEALVGLGLTEIWNLSLISSSEAAHCSEYGQLKIDDPKSLSYEYLRCDITSSLLSNLGASTDQEYPQRIFELAPIFYPNGTITGVREEQHAAALVAATGTNYTTAKSLLDGFLRVAPLPGSNLNFKPLEREDHPFYLKGRSAEVFLKLSERDSASVGIVGEISPSALESFGIGVPVSGFELNLEPLVKH